MIVGGSGNGILIGRYFVSTFNNSDVGPVGNAFYDIQQSGAHTAGLPQGLYFNQEIDVLSSFTYGQVFDLTMSVRIPLSCTGGEFEESRISLSFIGFTDQTRNPLAAVAVPEPSTIFLVALGLIFAVLQKRKNSIPHRGLLRKLASALLLSCVTGMAGEIGFIKAGTTFTNLSYPNASQTEFRGINDSGAIVGSALTGFLFSGGVFSPLHVPNTPMASTSPAGINNHGDIVGSYDDPCCITGSPEIAFHGFLYSKGTYVTIDVPNAVGHTIGSGLNDNGAIIGEYFDSSNSNSQGFLYSGGLFTTINHPTGNATELSGINNNGAIIGSYGDSSGFHGFLYIGGIFTDINYPGAAQTQPTQINNSGVIVVT